MFFLIFFFFSSRRRHTRFKCDWSSDVCSSDLRGDRMTLVEKVARALCAAVPGTGNVRSEERRVGKSVDLGGRRIIKKKKKRNIKILLKFLYVRGVIRKMKDAFKCLLFFFFINFLFFFFFKIISNILFFFFFQAEDGIRDSSVTGVQTCALPICRLSTRVKRAGAAILLRAGG